MSFWLKKSKSTILATAAALALIGFSVYSFQQQIPTIADTKEIYDSQLLGALDNVRDIVPKDAKIAVSSNSPQVTYFTDRIAQIPWGVDSEKALLQYMLLRNYTYLLVYEGKASEPKSVQLFGTQGIANLQKNFEKISTFTTDTRRMHLFQIRSNLTLQNINSQYDRTSPDIAIDSPKNSTIIYAQSSPVLINVTGSAKDNSKLSKVEVSFDFYPYKLVKPQKANDWSKWSYSKSVGFGDVTIISKATDQAGNTQYETITISVVPLHGNSTAPSNQTSSANPFGEGISSSEDSSLVNKAKVNGTG